jgi:hypothetical protein
VSVQRGPRSPSATPTAWLGDPSLLNTILRSRGTHAFYHVRVGADTWQVADTRCGRHPPGRRRLHDAAQRRKLTRLLSRMARSPRRGRLLLRSFSASGAGAVKLLPERA